MGAGISSNQTSFVVLLPKINAEKTQPRYESWGEGKVPTKELLTHNLRNEHKVYVDSIVVEPLCSSTYTDVCSLIRLTGLKLKRDNSILGMDIFKPIPKYPSASEYALLKYQKLTGHELSLLLLLNSWQLVLHEPYGV